MPMVKEMQKNHDSKKKRFPKIKYIKTNLKKIRWLAQIKARCYL